MWQKESWTRSQNTNIIASLRPCELPYDWALFNLQSWVLVPLPGFLQVSDGRFFFNTWKQCIWNIPEAASWVCVDTSEISVGNMSCMGLVLSPCVTQQGHRCLGSRRSRKSNRYRPQASAEDSLRPEGLGTLLSPHPHQQPVSLPKEGDGPPCFHTLSLHKLNTSGCHLNSILKEADSKTCILSDTMIREASILLDRLMCMVALARIL